MATTVIANQCVAGAMAGLMMGRPRLSFTASAYADIANAAAAIKDEFLTENTASGAALADGDNAEVGALVFGAAFSAVAGTGATSVTAADYLAIAKQIYAVSKQSVAKLA